jgi:hypothetical protein
MDKEREDQLLPKISTLTILTLAVVSIFIFPSTCNAISIIVSGTLKTIKTKRPTTKVGQRIRPIESIILFLIFVQFLFFPQQKP